MRIWEIGWEADLGVWILVCKWLRGEEGRGVGVGSARVSYYQPARHDDHSPVLATRRHHTPTPIPSLARRMTSAITGRTHRNQDNKETRNCASLWEWHGFGRRGGCGCGCWRFDSQPSQPTTTEGSDKAMSVCDAVLHHAAR